MNYFRSFPAVCFAAALCAAFPAGSAAAAAVPAAAPSAAPTATRTIAGRPSFAAELPGTVNQKAVREVRWHIAAAHDTPMMTPPAAPETISILGPAEATQEQMVQFILQRNPQPKLTCSVQEIVRFYYQEAGREGIRPDVALCQALKETGFFGYGGDVAPQQNNFCGLGATGNHEPGHSFATAQLGVRAHIQHLLAYASRKAPSVPIVDPRYQHLVRNRPDLHGKVDRWTGLNGAWAVPGKNYGQDILRLWQQAQAPDSSDAALDAAERKVRNMPDDAGSYLYRGIVRYKRGDYPSALSDFETALQRAPGTAETLYDHALTAVRLGREREAMSDYDQLLRFAPSFTQAWYNRGLMRFARRDYNGAIRDMEQLLFIEDRTADAYNLIGVAHIRQKKYREAWHDFYTAAAVNSANWNVLANQFILEACLK